MQNLPTIDHQNLHTPKMSAINICFDKQIPRDWTIADSKRIYTAIMPVTVFDRTTSLGRKHCCESNSDDSFFSAQLVERASLKEYVHVKPYEQYQSSW